MKIKVENSTSLYRDSESGAIINCSNSEYENYMELKNKKLREQQEIENIKNDVSELKSMMKLISWKKQKWKNLSIIITKNYTGL